MGERCRRRAVAQAADPRTSDSCGGGHRWRKGGEDTRSAIVASGGWRKGIRKIGAGGTTGVAGEAGGAPSARVNVLMLRAPSGGTFYVAL